jgi:dolichol kinase
MIGPLATGLIVLSLVIALVSLLTSMRNRAMGTVLLVGLGVLEVGLLVQAGFVIAGMVGGEGPDETATLIGYVAGSLVIPPVAVFWGVGERSRWGPAVIAVAGFAIPGMIGRMLQIWQGTV